MITYTHYHAAKFESTNWGNSQSEFYFSTEAKFQLFLLLTTQFITTQQMTNKTEVVLCINKICKQTLIIKY